ncbi:DUF4185 domain-containing protein [Bythopirellula polymerisocia]|uniref:DUF4185 domain-containing protein n=1 Tax=Bythopirellula polymerisocia TaxID=2528003 RepID=A0A5C6CY02_9BACT|nr:DUF4185 domain-containing protein [Bythopirellula polymerisocia]TWU28454.1 hypothetical protein Pla144_17440 [Bythopirellula polymerisocia]
MTYPISRRQMLKLSASGMLATHSDWWQVRVARGETELSKRVAAVRYLGNQFQKNPMGVTGLDCASSVVLPSGESLWVFGDTIEGPFESIRGLPLEDKLSNTAALVPKQDVSQGIKKFQFLTQQDGNRPIQIIPFADDENPADERIWPIHGICSGENIYLFYHRISLIPGVDIFENFELDGMGIAQAKVGEWKFKRLESPDGTDFFWKGDQPSFGVFVQQQEEYSYVWGSLITGMFLARTTPDKIGDFSSYDYLVEAPIASYPEIKPRWSKYFEPMASLFDSVPNEMSASYNPHLGCYLAIHSHLRDNKIVMRTSPEITGPWSDSEIVFRPEQVGDADLIYAAKEHPELARENGKIIYITFVNSATYVPQMIELTFL